MKTKQLPPLNMLAVIEYRKTIEPDGSDTIRHEFILPHEYVEYQRALSHIAEFGYILVSASIKTVGRATP